jgi:hypothetical protein
MDAILFIIGIVYGVCRIVIKSVQQCTYFLFSVHLLLVGVNKIAGNPQINVSMEIQVFLKIQKLASMNLNAFTACSY